MEQSATAQSWGGGNVRRLPAEPEWSKAHAALSKLARERASLDGREAVWLLRAHRARTHLHIGLASFAEYVERTLGFGPRTTFDRLRTAEVLEHLPKIRQALNDGELHWTAVRELARVATAETEAAWLAAAHDRTVRQIEQMVSGRVRGDLPGDPPRLEAIRHVLRFEVSAETFATYREAAKKLRQSSDEHLDDDDVLLLMARAVLGAQNPGKASYQIALTVCPECRQGVQRAGSDVVAVDPAIVDMAECDAQRLGTIDAGQTNATHLGQHEVPRATNDAGQTSSTHVGQHEVPRAAQTPSPARRRFVMRRDQGCCVIPGCRNSIFVDVHHIQWRRDGGQHSVDNLVVLCGAHHRAVHRGLISISRNEVGELTFTGKDGQPYGHEPPPSVQPDD